MRAHFPISIAPMMDYTDRHYRMLMRAFTKQSILYTEMISTGAILHGDTMQHLAFSPQEKPLVLQVGGDDPSALAECTRIASDYGYDEINLNTGCPSERVQKGSFGAALMSKPALVGDIVKAMCNTNTIPVSVKCRIGIDGTKMGMPIITDYESLLHFANTIFENGGMRLTVHARIAVLGGLSPKENRDIPPLQYSMVYRLAKTLNKTFPHSIVEINGGIETLDECDAHLQCMQGVMIGRAAIHNPAMFQAVDMRYGNNPNNSKDTLIEKNIKDISFAYAHYLETMQENVYTHYALRHIIPLYNGKRGARKWRQALSESLQKNTPPIKAVEYAYAAMNKTNI